MASIDDRHDQQSEDRYQRISCLCGTHHESVVSDTCTKILEQLPGAGGDETDPGADQRILHLIDSPLAGKSWVQLDIHAKINTHPDKKVLAVYHRYGRTPLIKPQPETKPSETTRNASDAELLVAALMRDIYEQIVAFQTGKADATPLSLHNYARLVVEHLERLQDRGQTFVLLLDNLHLVEQKDLVELRDRLLRNFFKLNNTYLIIAENEHKPRWSPLPDHDPSVLHRFDEDEVWSELKLHGYKLQAGGRKLIKNLLAALQRDNLPGVYELVARTYNPKANRIQNRLEIMKAVNDRLHAQTPLEHRRMIDALCLLASIHYDGLKEEPLLLRAGLECPSGYNDWSPQLKQLTNPSTGAPHLKFNNTCNKYEINRIIRAFAQFELQLRDPELWKDLCELGKGHRLDMDLIPLP